MGFFCRMVWQTWMNFLASPVLILPRTRIVCLGFYVPFKGQQSDKPSSPSTQHSWLELSNGFSSRLKTPLMIRKSRHQIFHRKEFHRWKRLLRRARGASWPSLTKEAHASGPYRESCYSVEVSQQVSCCAGTIPQNHVLSHVTKSRWTACCLIFLTIAESCRLFPFLLFQALLPRSFLDL